MIRIVCASPDIYLEEFASDDTVIAVDKGLVYCLDNQIKVDLAIGDFDSLASDLYVNYPFTKYPSEKDETDLELALRLVSNKDEEIRIYGALGGRIDHLLVNLRLLKKGMTLIDAYNKIYVIEGEVEIAKSNYTYISFMNLEGEATLSLTGFKYDLQDYILTPLDTLCVSNEILTKGRVKVSKEILVIESN